MREIKFRGKRINANKWIIGYLVITNWADDKKERAFITTSLGNYQFDHEVFPESVGQYTGLKDKNGKEIYEGDIVKWYWEYAKKWGTAGEVSLKTLYDGHRNTENGATGWVVEDCFLNDKCKVIGNIYENPELLK